VIATFALLMVVHTVLLNWSEVTNGPDHLRHQGLTTLWTVVAFGLISVVIGYWFKETGLGLKRAPPRGRAGRRQHRHRHRGRPLGGIHSQRVLDRSGRRALGTFHHHLLARILLLTQTFLIVTMLIVGGMTSISGAVVGTVVISAIFEGLRAIENAVNMSHILPGAFVGFTEVLLATAMIVLLIRRPAGVTGGQEIRLPRRPQSD
jgi:branched-chain amino acid transport system permease protein